MPSQRHIGDSMKQAGMSCILAAVLLLSSRSIGVGASALPHGDGVGGTNLVTRETEPIILSPADFNITVTDIPGFGNGKQSRDLNQAHSLRLNHKRATTSRRIDACLHPEDPYFIRSTCDHTSGSPNAKSYKLICNYRPTASPQYRAFNDVLNGGACTSEEFCFQNDHVQEGGSAAYCVSNSNVINLIQAGRPASRAKQVSLDTTGAGHNLPGQTVEVVITTPDGHAAIKMDSISVTALAMDKVNGQDSYRAQVGGTNACQGCSSIELPVVPKQTARLRWDFSFHGLVGGASMLVASWPTT